MFNIFKRKKTEVENIKNTITADAFGGFFDLFTTTRKGLELVPVYASVRILSQTIATSPLKLFKKTSTGPIEVTSNYITKLINQPYRYLTYFNFMQTIGLNLSARGNAYALIVRNSVTFETKELIQLQYDTVSMYHDVATDNFFYQVNFKNKSFRVWQDEILHFKVFSEDGKQGINPIELHRKTMDSASSEATYNEAFYAQAVNLSGVIEAPGRLTQETIDQIKDGFTEKFGGAANSGKTAVLSDGMTYKQLNLVSPMDANYVENAKLTRADIGVIFGVPLHMLGDLTQATFGNLGEMNRGFYKTTLAPYYVAIAQEIAMKLLPESLKQTHYFEFDTDILLSMGKKERYETYAMGVRAGVITRNEVRAKENLTQIDGLDEIMQESGMMTTSQADVHFGQSDVTTTPTAADVSTLKEQIKQSTLENKSDILSHLGRIEGLLKTSSKTSTKESK